MSSVNKFFDLAVNALNARRWTDAEQHFRKVLKTQPSHVPSLNLLTVVLMSTGRFAEAERFIARAVTLDKSSDVSFYNYGIVCRELKKFELALAQFSSAVQLKPTVAQNWHNRGVVLSDLKRHQQALEDFAKAIACRSDYIDAIYHSGKSLSLLNRHDEAMRFYERALQLNPQLVEAQLGRAQVFCGLKRYEDALSVCDGVLSQNPQSALAWLWRGNAYYGQKNAAQASADYDEALKIDDKLADAWLGRGNVLSYQGRHEDSLAAYDKALALAPELTKAWINRGNALCHLCRYEEALACYGAAQRTAPEFADSHLAEALVRLLLGEEEAGWRLYEARLNMPDLRSGDGGSSAPRWDGSFSIAGKTILLHPEQGLGDSILAARFVPMVAALGAKVVLQDYAPLIPLLAGLEGVAQLVKCGDPVPDVDAHCPLMSLPLALKISPEAPPNRVPYLHVPREDIERWSARLPGGINVGIGWAGNAKVANDHNRSILLNRLLPVLGQPNVNFFSLQKDLRDGDAEILASRPDIVQLGPDLKDFRDTAAVMMSLDLIISSDTSIVNLAGALGRPLWVLLASHPDWRWSLGENSSWFPTATLFRQQPGGAWSEVVDRVCEELAVFVDARMRGAAGITTATPRVAGQLGQGDDRLSG